MTFGDYDEIDIVLLLLLFDKSLFTMITGAGDGVGRRVMRKERRMCHWRHRRQVWHVTAGEGVGGGEVEAGDGQIPDVLVRVGLLYPLVLGSPVLEPDLDLGLGQLESLGQLAPPGSADVLRPAVLHLQDRGLFLTKCRSLTSCSSIFSRSSSHYRRT